MDMRRWAILFAVMVCIALAGVLFPSFLGQAKPVSGALYMGPPPTLDLAGEAHEAFAEAYFQKFENPAYEAFKSQPGLPSVFFDCPEEDQIKAVREMLVRSVTVPSSVQPTVVPTRHGLSVEVDGFLEDPSWTQAARFPVGIDGSKATLWMMADDEFLYLACDVPEEVTDAGYDQFRFYLHLGLTPWLVNERVHVGAATQGRVGGIRQTTIQWPHGPAMRPEERWKDAPISDWQIYEKARGASALDGHRTYEVVLELAECGLSKGHPFTARVEVETDPERSAEGKFRCRRYLGRAGAQDQPLWFVIEN